MVLYSTQSTFLRNNRIKKKRLKAFYKTKQGLQSVETNKTSYKIYKKKKIPIAGKKKTKSFKKETVIKSSTHD